MLLTSWRVMFLASISLSVPTFYTYSSSSPPPAYSIIIISCFFSTKAWWSSMMFLWRSFFKFEASLKMDCTALALCTTGGQLAGEGLTLFLDVHKLDRHLALGRDVLRQDYLAIAAFAELPLLAAPVAAVAPTNVAFFVCGAGLPEC